MIISKKTKIGMIMKKNKYSINRIGFNWSHLISGCVQSAGQAICGTTTETVNQYHCEYTSGCHCVHYSITGDCDSCACQVTKC